MLYSTITAGLFALAAAQKQQTLLDGTTNFDGPRAAKPGDNTIILYTEEYWEFKTAADNVNAQVITPSPALLAAAPTDVAVQAFDGQDVTSCPDSEKCVFTIDYSSGKVVNPTSSTLRPEDYDFLGDLASAIEEKLANERPWVLASVTPTHSAVRSMSPILFPISSNDRASMATAPSSNQIRDIMVAAPRAVETIEIEFHYHLANGSVHTATTTRTIDLDDQSDSATAIVTKTVIDETTHVVSDGPLQAATFLSGLAKNGEDEDLIQTFEGNVYINGLVVPHASTTLEDEAEAKRIGAPSGMFTTISGTRLITNTYWPGPVVATTDDVFGRSSGVWTTSIRTISEPQTIYKQINYHLADGSISTKLVRIDVLKPTNLPGSISKPSRAASLRVASSLAALLGAWLLLCVATLA